MTCIICKEKFDHLASGADPDSACGCGVMLDRETADERGVTPEQLARMRRAYDNGAGDIELYEMSEDADL